MLEWQKRCLIWLSVSRPCPVDGLQHRQGFLYCGCRFALALPASSRQRRDCKRRYQRFRPSKSPIRCCTTHRDPSFISSLDGRGIPFFWRYQISIPVLMCIVSHPMAQITASTAKTIAISTALTLLSLPYSSTISACAAANATASVTISDIDFRVSAAHSVIVEYVSGRTRTTQPLPLVSASGGLRTKTNLSFKTFFLLSLCPCPRSAHVVKFWRKGGEKMGAYRIAAICKNGHCIDSGLQYPSPSERFCEICGAEVIAVCPSCNTPIRGKYYAEGVLDFTEFPVPSYCISCGKPFPWTQSAIDAATAIIEDADDLDAAQRDKLVEVLPDIIAETPKTRLASTRFMKAISGAGKFTAEALRQFAIDFGCELAKQQLGL